MSLNSIRGRYLVRKSGMVDAIQFGSVKPYYLAERGSPQRSLINFSSAERYRPLHP
nr:MAG TPA: hypothetical protein [Caudoviricetes sp.]